MLLKKGLVYKSFIVIVSIMVVLSLSACGGGSKESSSEEASTEVNNSNDTAESAGEESNSSDSSSASDYDAMLETGVPPVSVGVTKYFDVKGKAYEMLTPVMDTISVTNPMAGLAFLPLTMADMSIIPVTLLGALPSKGNGVWEGDLMFLFNGNASVKSKGDINIFSMEVVDDQNSDSSMKIEGEYDVAKDSLKAMFTMGDGSKMIFEFAASGDGYVSQLYTDNEEGPTLIKNAFNGTKLFSGILEVNGTPDSIYQQKISDWENFVKNDNLMVSIDNGKGYTILDGEKFEY